MAKVKSDDLYKIALLDDAQISPDGKKAAYTKTKVCFDAPYYRKSIIVQCLECGEEQVIECGSSAGTPTWRSDSAELAFVGNATGNAQIYTWNAENGEVKQITSMRYGVGNFAYTPDEKGFYFIAAARANDTNEMLTRLMTEEEKAQEYWDHENKAIKVTGMTYRDAVGGFQTGEKGQLWQVQDGKVTRLSDRFIDFQAFKASPSGKYLAVLSEPTYRAEYRPEQNTLWGYNLEDQSWTNWADGKYVMMTPAWGADDSRVYVIGHDYEHGWNTLNKLWAYDLESGEFCCLTKDIDEEFANSAINDVHGSGVDRGPQYDPANNSFYMIRGWDGETYICSLNLDTLELKDVVAGPREISGFSFNAATRQFLYTYTSSLVPNDIELYDLASGEVKAITNVNAEYLNSVELSKPERIEAVSFDGLEIHGWLMKPVGFEEGKKYPAILEIHGGPSMMYSEAYMNEFQLFTANGFAVFFCNPRGGSGRGEAFEAGICKAGGGRGTNDFRDLMALTDKVAALDWIDETRIGVTGGSYGGFMTNWVVTHTGRFAAALTQRSITDLLSFRGTSDLGFIDAENSYETDYFDEEYLKKMSPITYVDQITTPLCILHSVYDYRCPLSGAEELYTALKQLDKPVEMYIFPNSVHGLSRNGRPAIRVQRLEIMVDWFNRYLK